MAKKDKKLNPLRRLYESAKLGIKKLIDSTRPYIEDWAENESENQKRPSALKKVVGYLRSKIFNRPSKTPKVTAQQITKAKSNFQLGSLGIRIGKIINPYIEKYGVIWVDEQPVELAFLDYVCDFAEHRTNKPDSSNTSKDYMALLMSHWDTEKIMNNFMRLEDPSIYVPHWIELMMAEGLFVLPNEEDYYGQQ